MNFGMKLKTLRKQRGWTQKDLASAIDVSERTIKNYESGKYYPQREEILVKICREFQVDPETLLGDGQINLSKETFGYRDEKRIDQALSLSKKIFKSEHLSYNEKKNFAKTINEMFFEIDS